MSETGLTLNIDALFTFLTSHQSARRKRSVYVIPGEPAHKFYRTKSGAQQAAGGGEVRKRIPSASMISMSIAELVRATVYWMLGATENSSDFGMLDGLYKSIEKSFAVPSAPVNVLGLRAAAVCPDEIVCSFTI